MLGEKYHVVESSIRPAGRPLALISHDAISLRLLERFSETWHKCFLQSSEDSSLQPQFSLTIYCCACEVTLVITDTLIAVLTYLLTTYKYSACEWALLKRFS